METIKLIDLLYNILIVIEKRFDIKQLPKTNLLKLAYLAEVEYYRIFQKRLTDTEWIYYKFGPYNMAYDEIINNDCFINEKKEGDNYDMILISLNRSCKKADLNDNQVKAINLIARFSKLRLNDLLDYVYFETEPMINANSRMELLNFECIPPLRLSKTFKTESLTPEMKSKLNKRFAELKKNA